MTARANHGRPNALLAVGAAVGLVLAGAGLIGARKDSGALPSGVVAQVNGAPIRADDFERMVAGVANDRRGGVDKAQRRQVLDRIIDEELLVQRGVELGLTRNDRKVRADLTAAVIASIVAEHEDAQPTDRELQTFYDQHRDFFAQPGRIHVRQIFCRAASMSDGDAALARAREAARRVRAGEELSTVREALGDRELSPLPDTALPPAKLLDYLGPTAVQTALSLVVGGVSDPVRSSSGYHVLQVVEREADKSPSLEQIRPQLLVEFRRRAGDQALRAYLDDLRSRADIKVAPKLP